MSLKIDPSGRRSVQVEVEVQGSSDEVWTAIGTGPGISCWFVPTEFDTLVTLAELRMLAWVHGTHTRSIRTD